MDKREVECQDCGYRWTSSANNPRCSQSDCGRSRNVEDVDGDRDDDPDEEEPEEIEDEPDDVEEEIEEDDGQEDDADDADDDGGYSPMFETRSQTTDVETSGVASDELGETTQVEDDDDQDDADEEEPDAPDVDPEDLQPALTATFGVIDARMLTDWSLEESEAANLSEAYAPVANKWAPYLIRQHGVEAAAMVTTAMVLGPKMAAEQEARQAVAEREDATDADPGTPRDVETIEDDRDDDPDDGLGFDVEDDAQSDDLPDSLAAL